MSAVNSEPQRTAGTRVPEFELLQRVLGELRSGASSKSLEQWVTQPRSTLAELSRQPAWKKQAAEVDKALARAAELVDLLKQAGAKGS